MAIYNGTQKIDVSGVDKVYVGTQLVYQKVTKQLDSIRLDYNSWPSSTNPNCFETRVYAGVTLAAWYQPTGSTFSFPGKIIATYSDLSEEDVTSQCVYSGYNMSSETGNGGYGIQISYTYNGVTKTVPNYVTFVGTYYPVYMLVKKVAGNLAISGYNTTLYKNDAYTFGGSAIATFTDGTTLDVTSNANTTYSGYNMSIAGTYTVDVNYKTYATWSLGQQTKTTASIDRTYQLTVSEWKTLWSGTASMTQTTTTAQTSTVYDASSLSLSGDKTFRITASGNASGAYTYYYDAMNSTVLNELNGTYSGTITIDTSTTTTPNLLQVRGGNSSTNYYSVVIRWNNGNSRFELYGNRLIFGTPTGSASMTVTKIEEYIE